MYQEDNTSGNLKMIFRPYTPTVEAQAQPEEMP